MTELLYLRDAYLREFTATVTKVDGDRVRARPDRVLSPTAKLACSHECVSCVSSAISRRSLARGAEGHDRAGCVPTGSPPRRRNPAASVIYPLVVSPLSRTRRSSGAVMTRCRSWPVALIRIERAECLATNNARSASTLPVPPLHDPSADSAARAASIASSSSDFPFRRRSCRLDDRPRRRSHLTRRGDGPDRHRTRRCLRPRPARAGRTKPATHDTA